MTEERKNSRSNPEPEGKRSGDPAVGQEGLDKVMLRVEGQNEHISTPSQEEQAEIGQTAKAVQNSTMGIEDES